MQMMLNMIRPADDRTAATQLRLQDLARSLSGRRPDGIVRQDASVRGWTADLNTLLGVGTYRTLGPSPNPRQALSIAALGRQFVARNGGASLPGGGTDAAQAASGAGADAFRSWSAGLVGKYVIVAPYAVGRVARGGYWLS